jgi:Protein of unknown function (DUF998)
VSTRVAALCGLLAPVSYIVALLFGGLAQRDGFSSADDAISDLGADTASSPWIYNRIGTNLTGILIFAFAVGLWRALSPDLLGRVGAGILALLGITLFLEGFFTLDCQGIDEGCENTSWQSEGHRWVSRLTAVSFLTAPIVLAFAFRRIPRWRDTWLPSLAAVPLFFAASVVFSGIGAGASTRAGSRSRSRERRHLRELSKGPPLLRVAVSQLPWSAAQLEGRFARPQARKAQGQDHG